MVIHSCRGYIADTYPHEYDRDAANSWVPVVIAAVWALASGVGAHVVALAAVRR